MNSDVRLATEDDAEAVQSIYAPIVRDTAISFETEPPSVAEIRQRIVSTLERLPWIVYDSNGRVRGYAYASPFRARAAYQWSVEVSVYVEPGSHRSGVGRALYVSLLERLRDQGYFNAYAGMTLPNPASAGLHRALGFEPVGVFRNAGFKFGAWHDVGWYQLSLAPPAANPPRPRGVIQ